MANVQDTEDKNVPKWTLVDNRKRSRDSPTENNSSKKSRQTSLNYWLGTPVPTSNSFDILGKETQPAINTTEEPTEEKIQKSPPIFVSGVENIIPLKNLLDNFANDQYSIKVINNNEIKIQPNHPEIYPKIVEQLKNRGTYFFTYQRKQDKGYKIVLKNMHPSVDINELKSEIESHGHKIKSITNMNQRITQIPLPLFFVELEPNENNKKIFEINKILNLIVTFEPLRKKRDIPQCMNCQEYGHTKNYCFKKSVCVKCAKNHLTSECPIKTKSTNVKCANCDGDHPASYKGCIVRKQLQQKLYPTLREKKIEMKTNQPSNNVFNNNTVKPNLTYAQATNRNQNKTDEESKQTQTQSSAPTKNNQLEELVINLMDRIDIMLNLITVLISKL